MVYVDHCRHLCAFGGAEVRAIGILTAELKSGTKKGPGRMPRAFLIHSVVGSNLQWPPWCSAPWSPGTSCSATASAACSCASSTRTQRTSPPASSRGARSSSGAVRSAAGALTLAGHAGHDLVDVHAATGPGDLAAGRPTGGAAHEDSYMSSSGMPSIGSRPKAAMSMVRTSVMNFSSEATHAS